MTGRRALFAVLAAATMAGSLALAARALSPGGLGVLDIVLLVLFTVTLPWMVVGFWNAVIGFVIMRLAADPAALGGLGDRDRAIAVEIRGGERRGCRDAVWNRRRGLANVVDAVAVDVLERRGI